jgi:hypothetical protein
MYGLWNPFAADVKRLHKGMNKTQVSELFGKCDSQMPSEPNDLRFATKLFQTNVECASWVIYSPRVWLYPDSEACYVYFDAKGVIAGYRYEMGEGRRKR